MISGRLQYHIRVVIVFCCVLLSLRSAGQIEASCGIDITYPELLNKNNAHLTYNQLSFGLRLGIAYKPPETQFFPILNFSFGRTRLPLLDFDRNTAAFNFNYLNVLLNENYVVHLRESELYIYGGIGFSYLNRKDLKIAGPGGEGMEAAMDSMKYLSNLFPAANIGFEYNYGESVGKPLYLTIGIDFQYIMMLADRNEYYITVKEPGNVINHYNAYLAGNVINPGFYIALHYLIGHSL